MRILAGADLFLSQLKTLRRSDSLVLQSRRVLDRLAFHLRGDGIRDLRAVEERHLVSFIRALQASMGRLGAPLSLHTQAAYVQRVKSFFAFLHRRGVLLLDPAAELEVPVASLLPRTVLSPRLAEKLMNTPSPATNVGRRDRAILETLYGTGIRRSECIRLDIADVDLLSGVLLVRNGKGRKDRVVPLPAQSARALDLYLREVRPLLMRSVSQPALFLTAWWGHRLSGVSLAVLVRRYGREIGIKALHPHALRHSCATHLLQGGADIRHVQEILGHRWLKTTAVYTRIDLRDLQKVIARAHPRERQARRTARD